RSVQGPDTEAQDLSPPNHHFPLATRGRSIQWCQGTKSLRDSPLRGRPSRERSYQGREERASVTKSAMPAELLRLAGGALRDHDVNEGGAAEVHRLVEGAAQVLRVLDKEALAAEGLHYPVIAGAVNQCVGLHVEHRAFRDLQHAGADAAIVQDNDL